MNRQTLLVSVLCLFALAGCSSSDSLPQRTNRIADMGRMPLPNSTYQLHGYRLDNGISHDHFVYLVEDAEGRLVAGSLSNQIDQSGKTSRNTAVNAEIALPVRQTASAASGSVQVKVTLACDSVDQCERKLAAIRGTD